MTESEITPILNAIGDLKADVGHLKASVEAIKENVQHIRKNETDLFDKTDKLEERLRTIEVEHKDQKEKGGCNNNVTVNTDQPLKQTMLQVLARPSVATVFIFLFLLIGLIVAKSMGLTF